MARPGLLILFTRYPVPGRSKSRLIPALGADGAAAWQREMTARTMAQARNAARKSGAGLRIVYEGADQARMGEWLGHDLDYFKQDHGGLGARMNSAFGSAFGQGYGRVVLFGSDIPGLNDKVMGRALELLKDKDLVLGPAGDGGYYLIGMKSPHPELFADVEWSTDKVLDQTLERAGELGVGRTETLTDVDRPQDLVGWRRSFRQEKDTVSIIIPALNEEAKLGPTLKALEGAPIHEVILVDGGSSDATVDLARKWGAKATTHPPGRAGQQNRGAAQAGGEILLFLHADTILPPDFVDTIRQTLALPGTSAGAFSLTLDGNRPGLRLVEGLAAFRSRAFQMPYGDQALFLRADNFWRAGGFPDQPLMEDFQLVRRLKRLGRVRTAEPSVLTSARRWSNMGIFKTTLLNQLIILAYYLKTPPPTLARLYNRGRGL